MILVATAAGGTKSVTYRTMTPDERRAYSREWAARNREHVNESARARHKLKGKKRDPEYSRAYRAANKEKLAEKSKVWWKNNPYYSREKAWHRQGINMDWSVFVAMLISQSNRCLICCVEIDESAHVDHNPHNGQVRGLLCRRCNNGLGFFRDDVFLMSRAITYLKEHACS